MSLRVSLLAMLAGALAVLPVRGQSTHIWTLGSTPGSFTTSGNWNRSTIPQIGQSVLFGLTPGWIVNFGNTHAVGETLVQSTGLWNLQGHTDAMDSLQISASLSSNFGTIQTGFLEITGGESVLGPSMLLEVDEGTIIGGTQGSTVLLSLHGGSILNVSDSLGKTGFTLGAGADDARLFALGLGTSLNVETWTIIGQTGNAELSLGDGAQFLGQNVILGEMSGSTGRLYVRNHGGAYALDLIVGSSGTGDVQLGENAWLEIHRLELGKLAGSSGQLRVNGGQMRVQTDAVIGAAGHGSVTVSNGGQFEVGPSGDRGLTVLGVHPSGFGKLQVTGVGSEAVVGETIIGQDGTAQLDVSKGGYIRSEGNTTIGSGSSASIGDQGSRWEVTGNLTAASGSTLTLTDGGKVAVQGPVLLKSGNLTLSVLSGSAPTPVAFTNHFSAASIINHGRLEVLNSLTLDTPRVINNGVIAVSDTYHTDGAKLRITGDLVQTGNGTIQMTLHHSNDAGYHTLMEIDGKLVAAGIFELNVYDPYLIAGQIIPLIHVHGDLVGDFSQTLLNNSSNLHLDLAWQGTTLVAHVVPEPSTWILMGLGFAGVVFYIRKRKLL